MVEAFLSAWLDGSCGTSVAWLDVGGGSLDAEASETEILSTAARLGYVAVCVDATGKAGVGAALAAALTTQRDITGRRKLVILQRAEALVDTSSVRSEILALFRSPTHRRAPLVAMCCYGGAAVAGPGVLAGLRRAAGIVHSLIPNPSDQDTGRDDADCMAIVEELLSGETAEVSSAMRLASSDIGRVAGGVFEHYPSRIRCLKSLAFVADMHSCGQLVGATSEFCLGPTAAALAAASVDGDRVRGALARRYAVDRSKTGHTACRSSAILAVARQRLEDGVSKGERVAPLLVWDAVGGLVAGMELFRPKSLQKKPKKRARA